MKLYIVKHLRKGRSGKDRVEYRLYTKDSAARGAMTNSMTDKGYYASEHTAAAVLYEVDLDLLTPLEERGTMVQHVPGQQQLF